MLVLIVTPDHDLRRRLEQSLIHSACETVSAHDARDALQSDAPPPDLALLDWNLPDLGGLELCRRLRAQPDNRFIYLILLVDRPEEIPRGLDAGAHDYITKPVHPEEVKSRVAVGLRAVKDSHALRAANERLKQFAVDLESLALERAQQLVRSDRVLVLEAMSSEIAHEINNPLTVVQGNLGLLKHFWRQFGDFFSAHLDQLPQPNGLALPGHQDIAAMFDSAERSVRHLRDIVDGIRILARGGGGKMEPLDHSCCLRDAIHICLPRTKSLCPVTVETEAIPFRVLANPVQITQILVNLISNAADALADTPNPAIAVRVFPDLDQRRLCLSVQDNGPGVPPEILEQIWNPLFTTKPIGKGTGLGLTICRKIADNHEGTLRVESPAGQGTTFILTLPDESGYARLAAMRHGLSSPDAAARQ